jgi:hypothetical protein
VNWRHRIAVVVLMVLAALPLAGTVCAMMCVPDSSTAAAHHEAGQECESAMSASSQASSGASIDARIGVLSESDCRNHDGAVPRMVATTAQRSDLAVISAAAASGPVHPLFGSLPAFTPLFDYTQPPGTAPPTTTPLVLRV